MSHDKTQITVTMPVEVYEGLIHREKVTNVISKYMEKENRLRELIKNEPKDSILYQTTEAAIVAYRDVCFDIQCIK